MATQKDQIVNGPSKFDLMLALFDSHGAKGKSRSVKFSVTSIEQVFTNAGNKADSKSTEVRAVHICGVESLDGSSELWKITAFTIDREKPEGVIINNYSTTRRDGSFQIMESALWR